jgi:HicB_like antitoxin of bacterial toxin-antitoxin system
MLDSFCGRSADCFSAGDTLDEAMENAKEAAELPAQARSQAVDLGLVTIDIASLPDKAERINITLPRMLRRIDQAAKEAGESRSDYIARRALG